MRECYGCAWLGRTVNSRRAPLCKAASRGEQTGRRRHVILYTCVLVLAFCHISFAFARMLLLFRICSHCSHPFAQFRIRTPSHSGGPPRPFFARATEHVCTSPCACIILARWPCQSLCIAPILLHGRLCCLFTLLDMCVSSLRRGLAPSTPSLDG